MAENNRHAERRNREERNKTVLAKWDNEVFNKHNLDYMENLNAPDYFDYNQYPGQQEGLKGFRELMEEFINAYPDMRSAPDPPIADGDFVVSPSFFIGTNSREFLGMAPTHMEIISRRVELLHFSEDGRIVERWGTGNTLEKLQMVGLLPKREAAETGAFSALDVSQHFIDEVINGKNLSAVADFIDRRARIDSKGALALLQLATAFPDAKVELGETMVSNGDKIVGYDMTFRGTQSGEYRGIEAADTDVEVEMSMLMRMSNGKIVDIWFDGAEENLQNQLQG